eukprot:1314843-Lingulodinium_polyedra.AAC.1
MEGPRRNCLLRGYSRYFDRSKPKRKKAAPGASWAGVKIRLRSSGWAQSTRNCRLQVAPYQVPAASCATGARCTQTRRVPTKIWAKGN